MHRMMEVDFQSDVKLLRWRPHDVISCRKLLPYCNYNVCKRLLVTSIRVTCPNPNPNPYSNPNPNPNPNVVVDHRNKETLSSFSYVHAVRPYKSSD